MESSSIFDGVRFALDGTVNTVFGVMVPPTCLLCDRFVGRQGGCCARCWQSMQFIREPVCPVMGTPFPHDMGEGFLSLEAIAEPPPFSRLRAAMLYDDFARRMVTGLKYGDRLHLAASMARWMVGAGKQLLNDCDVVVPVPLHQSRLRRRRFNQSAELAREIARTIDRQYDPLLLRRKRATRQQVGLSENERQSNVSGAFVVPPEKKAAVQGKKVVLVDDVYTSGATAKAATRALKRAGASHIDVLVFAKVETDPV